MTLAGLRILLAEDNPTNQMVATQMLESLDADVTVADDGAAALEILKARDFDVALIDIEMPRISGVELIRVLRAEGGRFDELPMIALTAYVMREHRAAIDNAGADGIIAKPILSIEQFGNEIRAILDKARGGTAADAPAAERSDVRSDGALATMDEEVFDLLCSSFDDAKRAELIGKISQDISAACGQIEGAQTSSDVETIRAATHILMSVSGTIGATRLQSLAQCLNSAGHAADSREIDRIAPDLVAEAARVLEFIDRA
jgi:CheY-like chemotaxis protein